jgi:hypothetical protein
VAGNGDVVSAVDTANSLDPADGDVAVVGSDNPSVGGDFDLAAVFGDMLHATATGSNYLVDILPSL